MSRDVDNLADVVAVVSELPICCLLQRQRFASNPDGTSRVRVRQRNQRGEKSAPAMLPQIEQLGSAICGQNFELGVPIAIGLFAITGE